MKQFDRDEAVRHGRIHDLDHVVSFAILSQQINSSVNEEHAHADRKEPVNTYRRQTEQALAACVERHFVRLVLMVHWCQQL